MDNSYKNVKDLSVYVKFPVHKADNPDMKEVDTVYLIAWTTTPWTLPANTALALNPQIDYSLVVDKNNQHFLVGADLIDDIFPNQTVSIKSTVPGQTLIDLNLRYQPLFEDHGSKAHRVVGADFVTVDEGSGIVQIAPAYGEEDYLLAKEIDLTVVRNLDNNGCYLDGPWQGRNAWSVNEDIIDHLSKQELIHKVEAIEHSYPHCHRCDNRLIYKVHPSWFLDIQSQKVSMGDHNQAINWFPKHFKTGRFHNTVLSAPDWDLSRDRFWATPLPVWRGQDQAGNVKTIVVGSYRELADLSGQTLDDYHRPFVDEIQFEKDGVTYQRIDKVMDCWFESGSMPFAQYHYPFENKQVFEDNSPADFIVEYVGQVRTWFYYLHAVSVALFDQHTFKNVVVTGTLAGSDGRKMSKSFGNYTDPLQLLDTYSADAYRLALMGSVVMAGVDFNLEDKIVADNQRPLNSLRHTLQFFLTYVNIDNWQPDQPTPTIPSDLDNILDRWILARLTDFSQHLTVSFNQYNLPQALKEVAPFIDDLSNWYVRRNRRRFWKTGLDDDKQQGFQTLWFVLWRLSQLLAPICPFIAEEIYHHLINNEDSVHLTNWPEIDLKDDDLVEQMKQTRSIVTEGLSWRASQGIAVRQPLNSVIIYSIDKFESDQVEDIIKQELNVKSIEYKSGDELKVELDEQLTPDLIREGLARSLVRKIQALRKKSGLMVGDRINLNLKTAADVVSESVDSFADYIKGETLTIDCQLNNEVEHYQHKIQTTIDDHQIVISLEVAKRQ